MAGIAIVILLTGGDDALQGLQNLIVITALPFSVVIVLMCVGLWKALRSDPRTYRQNLSAQSAGQRRSLRSGELR